MNDLHDQTDHVHALATALLGELRQALDEPALSYAVPPEALGGGFWADILAIRLDGAPAPLSGALVARVMPEPLLAKRETVVQRQVARQGFAAPAVRLAGDGVHGLGRPFMVMDRASGSPLMSGLNAANALVSIPRLARRLPGLLAATALRLHLLDPGPVVDALHREVPGASVDTADMISALRTVADQLGSSFLLDATAWLTEHQPEPERVSVCHGDLHPFNLLVDHDDHVTLVDWTASRVSEPAFDLAFTALMIRGAPVNMPAMLQPAIRRTSSWLADGVIATYRQHARAHGISVDDHRLDWHTALQCTRILTEVASWGPGERSGHPFHSMAAELERQLAVLVSG